MSEVELLAAVYAPESSGAIHVVLARTTDATVVAQETIDAASITANQPVRLSFPAQADSAGTAYRLELEGSAGVQVGFWRTSFNSLDGGELSTDGASPNGDLRLITRCRYSPTTVLQQTLGIWLPRVAVIIPLVLLLVVPGYVLGRLLGLRFDDPLLVWSVRVALSLAVVPVVLTLTTLLGLRWQRQSCLALYSLLALIAVVFGARGGSSGVRRLLRREHSRATAALAVILAVILMLRLIQIRNLALPAWVDSPQHVLITQLVTLHGTVPTSYEPLLPVSDFYYHFGFHAVAAVFAWLSGMAIPDAILLLGQIISVLCSLGAYALGAHLFKRRLPGIVAALLSGLVSYLPAYYVSWGRYTQLTGMALLPLAMICSIEWISSESRNVRLLLLTALLNAGLFLTHARVAVFGACMLAAYLLIESVARLHSGQKPTLRALWLRAAALLGGSMLFCLPWLARLASTVPAAVRGSASDSPDAAYNAVPIGLLLIRNNRQLFMIAGLGVLLGWQRYRREIGSILLACILAGVAVNPSWLGLPGTNLVNNASAVISLFLPLSVLGGVAALQVLLLLSALITRLQPAEQARKSQVTVIRFALLLALTMWSLSAAWGMASIVNPDTVLATAADVRAMQWIRTALPADSLFLISTRYWQLDMYVGTDGGYWIQPLTGRRTLLPPLPYVFGPTTYVQHTAELARVAAEVKDVDSPEFLDLLHKERVTHVYVGARGGALQPQMFLASRNYRAIYDSGAVWIFEVSY